MSLQKATLDRMTDLANIDHDQDPNISNMKSGGLQYLHHSLGMNQNWYPHELFPPPCIY